MSVHTVVSWVFAMTVQPMWHSTIFGPYFVVGAIFSGHRGDHHRHGDHPEGLPPRETTCKPIHFNNLGILLLVMTLLWFYFTFAEFLTTYYGAEPTHMTVFLVEDVGPFAPLFWTMVVSCFVIPLALLANHRTRTVKGTVVASISVIVACGSSASPSSCRPCQSALAVPARVYHPTWVEVVALRRVLRGVHPPLCAVHEILSHRVDLGDSRRQRKRVR